MRGILVFLLVFAVTGPAFFFPPGALSQSHELELEEMTQQADVIVVGRVIDVRSQWNSDRSRIFTNATVQVQQLIKGTATRGSVTITTPGGEIDGVGELYSHTPRFKTDEDVVVFAATDQQGLLRVVGGTEGKLSVIRDETTGVQKVGSDLPLGAFTSQLRRVVETQSNRE